MNKEKFNNMLLLIVIALLATLLPAGIALALSANYDKKDYEPIPLAQWNNLATDFLAKSGDGNGVMTGALNMGNNRIANVATPNDPNDAASGQYVDNIISSLAGGDTFVHWGRDECPAGSARLYGGFGFGSSRGDYGGGTNAMCLAKDSAGPTFLSTHFEAVYALATSKFSSVLPAEIPAAYFLPCAVCYDAGSSCYVKYNDNTCDGSYSVAYTGYVLGTHKAPEKGNYSSRKRICVDQNFQTVTVPGGTPADSPARLTSAIINDNFGISAFPENTFIRCAVCCN